MNLLFFAVAALFCIGYPTGSTDAPQKYVKVGCFKDKVKPQERALPELLFTARGNIDWGNLKQIVERCARKAQEKNYMYFSIQFYGECWSGVTAPMTHDRYGHSSSCLPDVGEARTNLVYRLVGNEQECLNYSYLNSSTRSDTYDSPPNPFCDNRLSDGWYRFVPPAGYRMASTCVPKRKCGTAFTGWLTSTHPAMTDGIVSGKVCFSWDRCCQSHQFIQIRNCGRFFVYKLGNTFNCPMRFCGNNTATV